MYEGNFWPVVITWVLFLLKLSWQMLTQRLTITITYLKTRVVIIIIIIKGISFFLHFFSLKYKNANRHYLQHPMPPQTHTALSASWGEVWRGQWGRLLDSEVLLWRGVLWPFMQPFWRFIPPFRMSWMCWTIKLMATARNMKMVDTGMINLITWDKHKYNLCAVHDSCTYQDCLRHVELSHLHISLSVRNKTTVKT